MNPAAALEIFAQEVSDDSGNAAVGLKLQNFAYEINLILDYEEVDQLITLTDWQPGSVQIGSVAGVAAFWSNQHGKIAISIGTDHETWDFCIWIDEADLQEIIEQTEQLTSADG